MEPASKQDEMYCLLGDHWVPGMVIAMAAILLCFLVALIWWKKWCHVIILWKLLGRPVEHILLGVSMAAWLHDLCQWWGGGQGLKGIITWGICLEEVLAKWTDDPMWFWNPAHLSQVGPGSWLRMVRDKNRTEEAQVFLGLWQWNYSSLFCCELASQKSTCLQFPHPHRNEKYTISTHTDYEITSKELSWCAQAILDKILPEGIWDVGGTSIAHVDQLICLWKPGNCQKLFLLVEPTTSIDTHIAETEVERLLRKMLLKLICTTLPITLNPSMQFLVFILLSWRAGRIKIRGMFIPKNVDTVLAATCIEELFALLRMTCLSLVLTASWGLHSNNSPYVKAGWECSLNSSNQAAYECHFKCFLGMTPTVWCC